jgi:hypothetical protein
MRLVDARYNYLYSRKQLEKWNTRIDHIAAQARTTYVVTNNHFQGKAVVNGLELLEMTTGDTVPVPPQLLAHYPELHASAKMVPIQRSLFLTPQPAARRFAAAAGAGPMLVAQ